MLCHKKKKHTNRIPPDSTHITNGHNTPRATEAHASIALVCILSDYTDLSLQAQLSSYQWRYVNTLR